jgi:predicted outer membrane protein
MKTSLAYGVAALALATAAAPAQAQSLFPFFDNGPATESTMAFRAEALRGDAYEIESSRVALQRTRDPKVRAYARQMIADHQKTTDALLPVGSSLNAAGNVVRDDEGGPFSSPLGILTAPLTVPVNLAGRIVSGQSLIDNKPGTPGQRVALDPRRQAKLQELNTVSRRDFKATYAAQQVAAHREAVALYRGYAEDGSLPEGRTFARQALPHLERHLDEAARLDDRYGYGTPAF